jgi:hypothetical protein
MGQSKAIFFTERVLCPGAVAFSCAEVKIIAGTTAVNLKI